MAAPIWKDKEVVLGNYDSVDFQIRKDSNTGDVIYEGRAYRRPGAANAVARVNDICAAYLYANEPTYTPYAGGMFKDNIIRTFVVQAYISGSWTDKETVTFVDDWSYDREFDHNTAKCLSDPIDGVLDFRQYFIQSALYANSSGNATFYYADGSGQSIALIGTHDLAALYMIVLSRYATLARCPATLTMNGKTWKVENTCARWVLHYINAYGGWDSIVMRGLDTRRDAITRHEFSHDYDNSNPRYRGIVNYVNEIGPGLTLNTDWLNDDQAAKMHHLLESPLVYVEDLWNPADYGSNKDATFIPVVITDQECVFKTFKNQGHEMLRYAVNVKLAQERYRR